MNVLARCVQLGIRPAHPLWKELDQQARNYLLTCEGARGRARYCSARPREDCSAELLGRNDFEEFDFED